jgi:sugar phosphate isomerase/epimerase
MSGMTRREFIQNLAMTVSVLSGSSYASSKPLPIGFSTLGCPKWEWLKILDFAQQNGFAAVELRGLQGTMDLPTRPEFAAERINATKRDVTARGLHISCVSSSANMHDTDAQKHQQQLADARRFIDLASALDAPYVRVFGNNIVGSRDQVIEYVAKSLGELGDYAGRKKVMVLIESHGDFVDSPTLRAVLEKAGTPHVGLLWDANHTYVSGKEDPAFTVSQLGKYIRHTHLKDSRKQGNDVHYVLTGSGEVPVKRQMQLLVEGGYSGYYSFEWEKVWHPELEEPEVALPDFARVATQYLKEAGFK